MWDKQLNYMIRPNHLTIHHELGFGLNYHCYADQLNWRGLISQYGRYFGGEGSISAMSGPRAVGYWGTWSGMVDVVAGEDP